MNQDYWELLDSSIELLRKATGHEWELQNTGGGHTAFMLNYHNGYYMITNDASAPVIGEWDDITLGWYPDKPNGKLADEGIILNDVTNLEALIEWSILWSGNLK